tara:strand:+ start:170052 stop:170813 length:762 start_codon:yes stop_codon:yes gene_type:complete
MTHEIEIIPPVDPAWALPDDEAPTSTPNGLGALTGPAFARLIAAAQKGGWSLVWTTWAGGETTGTERRADGSVYERPARRRTLTTALKKRPDLRAILEEAAQERRDRIVSEAEYEITKLALGPADRSTSYDKTGKVVGVREDSRNKLRALEQVLKAENRPKWGDHKRIEHEGQVNHAHAHLQLGEPGGYVVNFDALQTLPEVEQRQLLILLEKVEQARVEQRKELTTNGQSKPRSTIELSETEETDGHDTFPG